MKLFRGEMNGLVIFRFQYDAEDEEGQAIIRTYILMIFAGHLD